MCWPRWTLRGSGRRTSSAGELELHFARALMGGRVTGELRLPDGELVERISATEALALACGDAALALAA